MVALELADERLAPECEGHQRRSPVGRVRLARHESAGDECVHEPSDGSRRHLQRLRKGTLRHRTTPAELPEQMCASRRKPKRVNRLRHVVVQHDHELENAIEQILVLLKLGYSES